MQSGFESLADGIVVMSVRGDVDVFSAAAVFSVARRARRCDVSVVCRDPLRRLFGVAGLDRVVGLHRTRSDALRGASSRCGPPHAQRRPSL